MIWGAIETADSGDAASRLVALVIGEGTAGHRYAATLGAAAGDAQRVRGLADAVHYLSALHGRLPGVIDLALENERGRDGEAAAWLARAAEGFGAERVRLTRLVVSAGPLPSTPGHAACEAAVLGQRHALETLGRSERAGTALGAALALLLDWQAIGAVLDAAALRFDVSTVPALLPATAPAIADTLARHPAAERALRFGAQQLLAQHRGAWDLLEARERARQR